MPLPDILENDACAIRDIFNCVSDAEEILKDMAEDIEPPRKRLRGKQYHEPLPWEVKPTKTQLRARFAGLEVMEYMSLRKMGLPVVFFNLLAMLIRPAMALADTTGRLVRKYHCVEFYAGVGNVARAFTKEGLEAKTYDIVQDANFMNMSSAYAFLTAIAYCMMLRKYSLSHWASVCSTWIWISRSSTKRGDSTPWGTADSCSGVATANEQVVRMAMLFMLCRVRQVYWMLEQPMSSSMDKLSIMQQGCIGWSTRINTNMGAFGADSKKPTWLRSNGKWINVF